MDLLHRRRHALEATFSERLAPLLAPGCFYRAEPSTPDAWGTTVCTAEDFLDIGGYDEVIQGWGKDDEDFYARLIMAGVRHAGFPGEMVQAVTHSDTERVAHYDEKDHWLNASINHVYCRAKIDLMLLQQGPIRSPCAKTAVRPGPDLGEGRVRDGPAGDDRCPASDGADPHVRSPERQAQLYFAKAVGKR